MKNKKNPKHEFNGLLNINPLNANQKIVINSDNNLVLSGCPGTGKTFLAFHKALKLFWEQDWVKTIHIYRSAVPTRNIGHLPGKLNEKIEVYEEPYQQMCEVLLGRGDAYALLKQKGWLKFNSTSFIRGINLENAVVIVDEFQNMDYHELRSIITRLGNNCIVIFCGDFLQADLKNNGFNKFIEIISSMKKYPFDIIEFTTDDIVRSGLVKEFIEAEACCS